MEVLIEALESIRKEANRKNDSIFGEMIGITQLLAGRKKIKNCILTSRLTRQVLATAIQKEISLIITIFEPDILRKDKGKINQATYHFYQQLIKHNIGVYTIGNGFLISDEGGFHSLLKIWGFVYTSLIQLSKKEKNLQKEPNIGRIGERKETILFQDLLGIIEEHAKSSVKCLFYRKEEIKKIALFHKVYDPKVISKLAEEENLDLIVVGGISFEALIRAQQQQLTLIVIGQRVLENQLLTPLQRKLLSKQPLEHPTYHLMKQRSINHRTKLN
jgi:putative NIF3 family GTP cyclohydrolase 1 type 2